MYKLLFQGLVILCLLPILFTANAQKLNTDWAFIYWMPYDNNLSPWADSIISIIGTGISSDKVLVTIQTDRVDGSGMERYILSHKGQSSVSLVEENSASGKVYNSYLKWVSEQIVAKKYAIIFLDHGGKLDEIGLDENPVKGFMRIDSARMAIENFNRETGQPVELVFFQVCTKGSIEPIYELRNVANYTMASQTILGAPNFYYKSLFDSLSRKGIGISSGLDVAKLIAQSEREDMFYSYTCVDNKMFDQFDREFTKHINLAADSLVFNLYDNLPLSYYGERYLDFTSYLNSLQSVKTNKLKAILEDSLIVMNEVNPKFGKMNGYSGLSLLSFAHNYSSLLVNYSHLAFFKKFDMTSYYNKLRIRMNKK